MAAQGGATPPRPRRPLGMQWGSIGPPRLRWQHGPERTAGLLPAARYFRKRARLQVLSSPRRLGRARGGSARAMITFDSSGHVRLRCGLQVFSSPVAWGACAVVGSRDDHIVGVDLSPALDALVGQ